MTWSFCVWYIADSQGKVSSDFRDRLIEEYLVFVLELGWEPSEVYFGPVGAVQGLQAWRDLFLHELQTRFAGDRPERIAALHSAMDSLDQGKGYVFKGSGWLRKNLP